MTGANSEVVVIGNVGIDTNVYLFGARRATSAEGVTRAQLDRYAAPLGELRQ